VSGTTRADAQCARILTQISPAAINDISGLVQNQHYQLACVKYFEVTHNVDQADLVLQHPNQYYEKSRELRTGEKNEGEGKGSYRKPAATPTAAAETPTAQADEVRVMLHAWP